MGAHTTTDDPTRYRLSAELESWKLKDPIERVKQYLIRSGLADESFFAAIAAEADELGARVRRACLEMPDPDPLTMFDNVYVDQTRPARRGAGAASRATSARSREEAAR